MTIFGIDISSYQRGLDLGHLGASSFVLAKTTEGTYYTDAFYQGWRQQAAALGKPFVWYHFLSGEDARAQAAHTLANVGDTTLPGMLDFEPAGSFNPTLAQAVAYVDAATAAGLRLRLVYLPRWYWRQIGSPDLSALAARGLSLVSSSYVGGSGNPTALYPGDSAAGWQAYGGMAPLLYQFTDRAADGGQSNLDYNAFRGTVAELMTELGTVSQGASDVNLTDKLGPVSAGMAALTPDAAAEGLGQGSEFSVGAALLGMTVRQAETLILIKRIADAVSHPQVTIDEAALAAHLAPLLAAGPTADQVAQAVVAHLGASLQNG